MRRGTRTGLKCAVVWPLFAAGIGAGRRRGAGRGDPLHPGLHSPPAFAADWDRTDRNGRGALHAEDAPGDRKRADHVPVACPRTTAGRRYIHVRSGAVKLRWLRARTLDRPPAARRRGTASHTALARRTARPMARTPRGRYF